MNLNHLKSEKGQSVILMAMMILSFLMFFSFVINTGLLIAAKISVQTAADAAAYAGAATQARQLNAISFLNYDLKRQYKKFIYRYSFVGNLGSPDFPKNPTVGSNPNGQPQQLLGNPNGSNYSFWKRDYTLLTQSNTRTQKYNANLINVPVVCIPLTSKGQANDSCLNLNLPNTANFIQTMFGNSSMQTQITKQLLNNINQIQNTSNQLCQYQGQLNLFVLLQWLFRGTNNDNDLINLKTTLLSGLPQNDQDDAIKTVTSLVKGLGLYPRNILTLLRIQTLEGFLNAPALRSATKESIASLEASASTAEVNERSILAFKSALSNLNNDIMAHDTVEMTELQSNQQIKLEPFTVDFNAYVQLMEGAGGTAGTSTICNSAITPFEALSAPVAMNRTPGMVHYAVKVKAKAKLLFLPIKDGIELEAVSAAKPFGARIGPNATQGDFVETITPGNIYTGASASPSPINDCQGKAGCFSPRVLLNGVKMSYEADYLKELAKTAAAGGNSITLDGIIAAQDRALAPSAYDIGRYNILPPAKSSKALQNEYIAYNSITSPPNKKNPSDAPTVYRFYAPLFPQSGGDPMKTVEKFLNKMLPTASTQKDAKLHIDLSDLNNKIKADISNYLSDLKSKTNTENQETVTFAAIELPIQNDVSDSNGFWLNSASAVRTSWGPNNGKTDNGKFGLQPRFGYSVKFVALQSLLKAGMADPDGDLEKVNH